MEFFTQINVATTLYTIQRVWANNIIWSYWLRMQVGVALRGVWEGKREEGGGGGGTQQFKQYYVFKTIGLA